MSPAARIYNFEVPDWVPLEAAVAAAGLVPEVAGEFMWMCENPQGHHQYKHRITRRYAHIRSADSLLVRALRVTEAREDYIR